MKYILLDIEGTTTPIDFVHQVLFPYSAKAIPEFVVKYQDDAEVKECLDLIEQTATEENFDASTVKSKIDRLLLWIESDRKHPALKKIQGLVWKFGYESGVYTSTLYEDVSTEIEKWISAGNQVGIYSSGSIQAQKLLFKHTEYGDLTPNFSYFFDTSIGQKREKQSYANIIASLECDPKSMWFLSDISEELDAAKENGINTVQIVRPGTVPCKNHMTANDFAQVTSQF